MVHYPKRKLGVISFIRKNTKPGEGVEGGLAKHQTFQVIFFVKPSHIQVYKSSDFSSPAKFLANQGIWDFVIVNPVSVKCHDFSAWII